MVAHLKTLPAPEKRARQWNAYGRWRVGRRRSAYVNPLSIGDREYIIDVPADYHPTHPYRLIFSWHQAFGSANGNELPSSNNVDCAGKLAA